MEDDWVGTLVEFNHKRYKCLLIGHGAYNLSLIKCSKKSNDDVKYFFFFFRWPVGRE